MLLLLHARTHDTAAAAAAAADQAYCRHEKRGGRMMTIPDGLLLSISSLLCFSLVVITSH
jgi:hypothetical protein